MSFVVIRNNCVDFYCSKDQCSRSILFETSMNPESHLVPMIFGATFVCWNEMVVGFWKLHQITISLCDKIIDRTIVSLNRISRINKNYIKLNVRIIMRNKNQRIIILTFHLTIPYLGFELLSFFIDIFLKFLVDYKTWIFITLYTSIILLKYK